MVDIKIINKQFKFVSAVPDVRTGPGRRKLYTGVVDRLRKKPNRWALIATLTQYSDATYLRNTLRSGYPVEVRVVRNEDGSGTVYARYIRSKDKTRPAARRRSPVKKRKR